MDTEAKPQPDLATHLAAERTFLAWIRTGVACMGFGFVVARFGIFLNELRFLEDSSPVLSYAQWLGTALVAAGVLMNVISAWHHARLVGTLNRGEPPPSRPSAQAIALALLLAIIGLGLTIHLISLHRARPSEHSIPGKKGSAFTKSMTNNGMINKLTPYV